MHPETGADAGRPLLHCAAHCGGHSAPVFFSPFSHTPQFGLRGTECLRLADGLFELVYNPVGDATALFIRCGANLLLQLTRTRECDRRLVVGALTVLSAGSHGVGHACSVKVGCRLSEWIRFGNLLRLTEIISLLTITYADENRL